MWVPHPDYSALRSLITMRFVSLELAGWNGDNKLKLEN